MVKVILYKGFAKSCEKFEVNAGLPICKMLAGDIKNWDNCLILSGGRCVNKDYIPNDNDIVMVRELPGAATVTIILAAVAVTAVAVSAIVMGVETYKQKQRLSDMQDAEKNAKKAGERPDALPFVKGANNQAATGQSFPYIIGETLMTPYRLASPHYTIGGINGNTQYYNVCLECGFNDLVFEKISIGNTTIKTLNEGEPQNSVYDFDNCLYYDAANKIEIVQRGEFKTLPLNKKIVCTSVSKEIPYKHGIKASDADTSNWDAKEQGIIQELPDYPMKTEVCIEFEALRYFDDGWRGARVNIIAQWAYSDEATVTWHDFDKPFIHTDSTHKYEKGTGWQFLGNGGGANMTMRFIATQEFNPASYGRKISVRCKRTSEKYDQDQTTCQFLYVNTYCYDNKKSSSDKLVAADILESRERGQCVRLGLTLKATASTSDTLDSITTVISGVARVWDGDKWSVKKVKTSNLAAWVLEILTSDAHRMSKYNDDEIDLESFGEWYEYCEAEHFTANGVISKAEKKENIVSNLCENGNATLVYDEMTGKITVAIDNGRDYAIALLNGDTITSITTSKKFARLTDGKRVKYIDAAGDYQVETAIVMADGTENYDPATQTLTESTLNYVTDYNMAHKIAWRQIMMERARPRQVTVKTGNEGVYYPLYSKVELQHRIMRTGVANGVITKVIENGTGVTHGVVIDAGVCDAKAGNKYGVIIQCMAGDLGVIYARGDCTVNDGRSVTIIFDKGIPGRELQPEANDFASIGLLDAAGEFSLVTNEMLITGVESCDNGYQLTLVDYNEDLYKYHNIPVYKSNLTRRPDSNINKDLQKQLTLPDVYDAISDATKNIKIDIMGEGAQEAADLAVHGVHFASNHILRDVTMSLDELLQKIDEVRQENADGISISENEVLIQMEDKERGLQYQLRITAEGLQSLAGKVDANDNEAKTLISQNADNIDLLAQKVDDNDEKTTAALNVNSNSITAAVKRIAKNETNITTTQAALQLTDSAIAGIVEGGGAEGQMALSLELPAMITVKQLQAMQDALVSKGIKTSSEAAALLSNVYKVSDYPNGANGSNNNYTIKDTANKDTIGALWDALKRAGYLASQITLDADQIHVNGLTVFEGTQLGQTIMDGGYLKTELIDAKKLNVKNVILDAKGTSNENDYSEECKDAIEQAGDGGLLVSNNLVSGGYKESKQSVYTEVKEETIYNLVPQKQGDTQWTDFDTSFLKLLSMHRQGDVVAIKSDFDGEVVFIDNRKYKYLSGTATLTKAEYLGPYNDGGNTDDYYIKSYTCDFSIVTENKTLNYSVSCRCKYNSISYPMADDQLNGTNIVAGIGWNVKNHTFQWAHTEAVAGESYTAKEWRGDGAGVLIDTNGAASFMQSVNIGGSCTIRGNETAIFQPDLIDGFNTNGVNMAQVASCTIYTNAAGEVGCKDLGNVAQVEKVNAPYASKSYKIHFSNRVLVPFVEVDGKDFLCLQVAGAVWGGKVDGMTYRGAAYPCIHEATSDCAGVYGETTIGDENYKIVDYITVYETDPTDNSVNTIGMAHLMFYTTRAVNMVEVDEDTST